MEGFRDRFTTLVLLSFVFSFILSAISQAGVLSFNDVLSLSKDVPEVRSAYHQLKSSEYSLKGLKSSYGPKVELFYNYIYYQPEILLQMPTLSGFISVPIVYPYNYQWGVRVSKLVYFNSLNLGLKARASEVRAKEYTYLYKLREARLKAVEKYLEAYRARQLLKVAKEAEGLAEEVYRVTQELYKTGLASKFELLTAEANLRKAQANLEGAKEMGSIAERSLISYLGLEDGELEFDIFDKADLDLLISGAEFLLRDELPEVPIDELPEVLALKESKRGLNLASKAKREENSPRLAIALEETNQRATLVSKDWNFRAVISLSWPLFDSGSSEAEARSLEEKERALDKTLERLKSSIIFARKATTSSLKSSLWSLRASLAELRAAEESYEIALIRYKNGLSNQVELINAQTRLAQARSAVASQRAGLILNMYKFLHFRGYEVRSWEDILRLSKGKLPELVTDELLLRRGEGDEK